MHWLGDVLPPKNRGAPEQWHWIPANCVMHWVTSTALKGARANKSYISLAEAPLHSTAISGALCTSLSEDKICLLAHPGGLRTRKRERKVEIGAHKGHRSTLKYLRVIHHTYTWWNNAGRLGKKTVCGVIAKNIWDCKKYSAVVCAQCNYFLPLISQCSTKYLL